MTVEVAKKKGRKDGMKEKIKEKNNNEARTAGLRSGMTLRKRGIRLATAR